MPKTKTLKRYEVNLNLAAPFIWRGPGRDSHGFDTIEDARAWILAARPQVDADTVEVFDTQDGYRTVATFSYTHATTTWTERPTGREVVVRYRDVIDGITIAITEDRSLADDRTDIVLERDGETFRIGRGNSHGSTIAHALEVLDTLANRFAGPADETGDGAAPVRATGKPAPGVQ